MLDKTWKYSIRYENFLKPDKQCMLTKRAPYNLNRKGGEYQKLNRDFFAGMK